MNISSEYNQSELDIATLQPGFLTGDLKIFTLGPLRSHTLLLAHGTTAHSHSRMLTCFAFFLADFKGKERLFTV